MPFTYSRTIRFQDTDAAGVVYFANVLAICHEAYEESLNVSNINLQQFFRNDDFAIPIVHASADFLRPMFCGDRILINLSINQLNSQKFEINYQINTPDNEIIAKAITRHICIDPNTRTRKEVPSEILYWLQLLI
ncbi:acyl-CoA thioesterase [Phormidium sp. LEGE 05292]|uniref:acyl-CoA thioesterase n=1 Tax=[Phormidium] sp. LEGE 05292 TaxID=767427 RepID=UPI00187FF0EE|nr:thioesterase family protein [Phormidium sp. LEGE 05292]MBE9225899.1 acyl-CoA thioesterase [Phormidium sp. LEGE 05292]